ncbi:MAG: hypothetical protein DRN13_03495 [Thermoplasmata archaeon]|nr:MAG: hypothetical protein DRN13_03495 [Thermoplasmata archaeon]
MRRILIDPINPDVIYAGVAGVNASCIYMSEDGGESWFPCPFPKLEMNQGKRYSLYDGNTFAALIGPSNTVMSMANKPIDAIVTITASHRKRLDSTLPLRRTSQKF